MEQCKNSKTHSCSIVTIKQVFSFIDEVIPSRSVILVLLPLRLEHGPLSTNATSLNRNRLLTRRQALTRLGVATGGLVASTVWSAQGQRRPRPATEIKGGERMLQKLEQDRLAKALPKESDCPQLTELRERYDRLPSKMEMIATERDGNVVRLAVEKRGNLESESIVVMIHGLLADRETWIYVAGALGNTHQLWLIDLPGCGSSECPNPSKLEPDAFTPTGMADRLLQVIESCIGRQIQSGHSAARLLVVGHSLGGTICLRMAGDLKLRQKYACTLNQIDAMVLFAPADVAINSEISSFIAILGLNGVKIRLGQILGIAHDKVRNITRDAYHVRPCATQEQAERFTNSLTHMGHLRAAQAMIRSAVPWRIKEHRPDWPEIKRLEACYSWMDVPCVITWGEWDETLTECMGHKIRDELPLARLVEIEGAGHCLPSEVPLQCAEIIETTNSFSKDKILKTIEPVTRYGEAPFDQGEPPFSLGNRLAQS